MERGRVGILLLRDNSFSEEPRRVDRPAKSIAGSKEGVDSLYEYGYEGASSPADFKQMVRAIYGVGQNGTEKPLSECIVIADKECPTRLIRALGQLESRTGLTTSTEFDVLESPLSELDEREFNGWLSTRTFPASVQDTFDSLLDDLDFEDEDGEEEAQEPQGDEFIGEPDSDGDEDDEAVYDDSGEPEYEDEGDYEDSDEYVGEGDYEDEEDEEPPTLALPTLTEEEIREAEEHDLADLPEEAQAGYVGGDLDDSVKPVGADNTATASFAVDEARRLERHNKRVSRLVGLDDGTEQVSVPMEEMDSQPDGLPKDEASSERLSEEAPPAWENEGGAVAPDELDDFDFGEELNEDAPYAPEDDQGEREENDQDFDDEPEVDEPEVEVEPEPQPEPEVVKPKGRKKVKASPTKGRDDVVDPEKPVSYKKEPMSTISMSEMKEYGSLENDPRAASQEFEVYKSRRHPETRVFYFTGNAGGTGKTTMSMLFQSADQLGKAMLARPEFGGHAPSATWLIETDFARPKLRNRLPITNPELTMTGLIMEMNRRGGNVSNEELCKLAERHSVATTVIKKGRPRELPSARILACPTSEDFAEYIDVDVFKNVVQRIVDALTLSGKPVTIIIDGPDFAPESIDDLQVRLGNNRADRIFVVADGKEETVREIKEVRSGIINAKNGRIPSGSEDRVQVILNMVTKSRYNEIRSQFNDGTIFTPRFGYIKQIARDSPEEDRSWIGNVDHQDMGRFRMTALNILCRNGEMDKLSIVIDSLTKAAKDQDRKSRERKAKESKGLLGRFLSKI